MAEFKIDAGAVSRLSNILKEAGTKTAYEILRRTVDAQVIPFETGHMQNDETYVDESGADKGIHHIVSNTPYARRLYFNPQYDFRTDGNANARGEWMEMWINGSRKEEPKQILEAFIRQSKGGVIK